MLNGYRIFDGDAHATLSPRMWEDLPKEYRHRRPRPARVFDAQGLGAYDTGWLIEGRVVPHVHGPGSQQAGRAQRVLAAIEAGTFPKEPKGSMDMTDPQARLKDLDSMGIDAQVVFPSTLYARMTSDPGFEAALYRAYNRYMSRQCAAAVGRLKWGGLLPLRDERQALAAVDELVKLGASTAVVFGTAGDRLLSHPSFIPVWDAFAKTGLPVCVHMGMSYPPLADLCQTIFDGHVLGMSMPALLAFVALVGHGMLDRYPKLNVGFLEFGAEWIFYMMARMDHYLPLDREDMPNPEVLPKRSIEEYVRSGRIFISVEAEDRLLRELSELVGDEHILFSSDFPHHSEGRENAAAEILERKDLTENQKRNLLYHNTVRFFGEP
jgi:hypothetical protein